MSEIGSKSSPSKLPVLNRPNESLSVSPFELKEKPPVNCSSVYAYSIYCKCLKLGEMNSILTS